MDTLEPLLTAHPFFADLEPRFLQVVAGCVANGRFPAGAFLCRINVCVGGFYKVPTRRDLAPLAERLTWAHDAALDTVRWVATLAYPEFEQNYEFVALRHAHEYPFNKGRLVSNKGLDIAVHDYETHVVEEYVAHSNTLHAVLKDRGAYLVDPLARYNLNFDRLSPLAQEAARQVGLEPVCRNP